MALLEVGMCVAKSLLPNAFVTSIGWAEISGSCRAASRTASEGTTPAGWLSYTGPVQDQGRDAVARKVVLHAMLCQNWIMKTNVTLKLDADLLREARVLAAEEGRSVSALLTDRLEALVRERKAFDRARRRALARLRDGFDLRWTPSPSRDELHER